MWSRYLLELHALRKENEAAKQVIYGKGVLNSTSGLPRRHVTFGSIKTKLAGEPQKLAESCPEPNQD
jgi:hypothetical protein